jgi:hypothetical protein
MCQRTTSLKRTGGREETNPCIIELSTKLGEWSASCSSSIMSRKAKQIKILNLALYEGMFVWHYLCKQTDYWVNFKWSFFFKLTPFTIRKHSKVLLPMHQDINSDYSHFKERLKFQIWNCYTKLLKEKMILYIKISYYRNQSVASLRTSDHSWGTCFNLKPTDRGAKINSKQICSPLGNATWGKWCAHNCIVSVH